MKQLAINWIKMSDDFIEQFRIVTCWFFHEFDSNSAFVSLVFELKWITGAKEGSIKTAESVIDTEMTETKENGAITESHAAITESDADITESHADSTACSTDAPAVEEEEEATSASGEELVNEQELKYWKAVKENPADFTSWTYLLQFVEQEVCGNWLLCL